MLTEVAKSATQTGAKGDQIKVMIAEEVDGRPSQIEVGRYEDTPYCVLSRSTMTD